MNVTLNEGGAPLRPDTGMTTLGALAERVGTASTNHTDKMIPVKRIHFPNGIESVVVGNDEYTLREQAQRQLSARLGIPHPYLKKCPRGLQESQLNHWLRFEENEQLFFRFDRREVRAIFTPRYKAVDNVEIIEELFSMGYTHETRVQARYDSEFLSVSIPDGTKTFDINGLGDRITPGISVSNSEVGVAAVSVSAFLWRLVCSNGMVGVTTASLSKRHISSTVLEGFPSMLEEATKGVSAMRRDFKISIDTRVANPTATFEKLNRQFLLSDCEREATQWGYEQEPGDEGDVRMFHIANAYTKGSQLPGLSAHSSTRLQRAGGQVISMVGHY